MSEDDVESCIAKFHSTDVAQHKVVEYVNELYDVSREQSIPLHEVPNYIKQQLEAKQKIDQEIKEANEVLQKMNMTIEAVEEHLKLKEALSKHELSTDDIDKLVNLVSDAKERRFDSKKIVKELRSIMKCIQSCCKNVQTFCR
jgi:hypothetical protein